MPPETAALFSSMPSRKGQDKQRQRETRGDFALDGIPRLTHHARTRMQDRGVGYSAVMHNKESAGIVQNEATGAIITVIPPKFVQHRRTERKQERGKVENWQTTTMSTEAALKFLVTKGATKKKEKAQDNTVMASKCSPVDKQENKKKKGKKEVHKNPNQHTATVQLEHSLLPDCYDWNALGVKNRKKITKSLCACGVLVAPGPWQATDLGVELTIVAADAERVLEMAERFRTSCQKLIGEKLEHVNLTTTEKNPNSVRVHRWEAVVQRLCQHLMALNIPPGNYSCVIQLEDSLLPLGCHWRALAQVTRTKIEETLGACGVGVVSSVPWVPPAKDSPSVAITIFAPDEFRVKYVATQFRTSCLRVMNHQQLDSQQSKTKIIRHGVACLLCDDLVASIREDDINRK